MDFLRGARRQREVNVNTITAIDSAWAFVVETRRTQEGGVFGGATREESAESRELARRDIFPFVRGTNFGEAAGDRTLHRFAGSCAIY